MKILSVILLAMVLICNSSLSVAQNTKNKNPQPLAMQIDTSSECKILRAWGHYSAQNTDEYIRQYDSVRKYIELCANDEGSFHSFTTLSGDCYYYSTDTLRFERFRDWLISVLYLNTKDPSYFCADLGVIVGTYGYGKWNIPNAGLAIIKYLMDNPNCNSEGLRDEYNNTLRSRHDTWVSRGSDPKVPEDTVLPSLDKLGLGFLLKNTVTPATNLASQYLASFTSTPNPFKAETTLSFELNRMAYVTVEVFDPLGRKVWGDDHGYSLDKGLHLVHLDGAKLSSGSYYARISTGFGEVKTVKIIKE